jgi:hypothetical protein
MLYTKEDYLRDRQLVVDAARQDLFHDDLDAVREKVRAAYAAALQALDALYFILDRTDAAAKAAGEEFDLTAIQPKKAGN